MRSGKELPNEIARRGFKKAFVVCDKDLLKFRTAQMALVELKDTPYELFTDFKANPTVTNVKDGVKAFKEVILELYKKAY